ncbi:MAG: cyclic lactone autoinducer peptide [Roseburia sp.]|nr:cyclic lactone autoinducer peptide [Roseburia sp.]
MARTKAANGLLLPPFCMGIYHQPKRPKVKLDK